MSVASPKASVPMTGSARDARTQHPKDASTKPSPSGAERDKSNIPISKDGDHGRKEKISEKNSDFNRNEDDGDSSGAETWDGDEEENDDVKTGAV